MSRTYLVFGDIEGKLDVLRVECTKCDRRAAKLIAKHGRKGNMSANGMVRPCSCPASDRSWQGAPKTRSTPCPTRSKPQSP